MAADLVGADKSAVPLVHPFRWPGSWNTKNAPRMARSIEINEGAEVELRELHEILCEALGHETAAASKSTKPKAANTNTRATDRTADGNTGRGTSEHGQIGRMEDVHAALEVIPNDGAEPGKQPGRPWSDWNKVLMAIFAATDGSEEGREAARVW